MALLGLLLMCRRAVTGPLPGPGGIPIALLGIAVWSSEFEWAQRLMYWFKAQLKRYLAWPLSHRHPVLGGLRPLLRLARRTCSC